MGQVGIPQPKPERRAKTKARADRVARKDKKTVREYVFEREQNICRCCRLRPAESMHEIRFRSLGGKVSKTNSIAVCGNGVAGCHGFLQRNAIYVSETPFVNRGAEGELYFQPHEQDAADYMRVALYEGLASGPTPQIRGQEEHAE